MNDETDGETVRWMSYTELGRLRGTSAATARRMANRKRWKKLPGNDGTIRVAVPAGLAVSRETSRETSRDLLPQALAALEAALVAANIRADRAETHADAQRATIDELRAGQALMLDVHARELAVARHDALAAQQAAAELRQAEAARKARGRLRRAWDGWRGR
jgi:hypothetical protein